MIDERDHRIKTETDEIANSFRELGKINSVSVESPLKYISKDPVLVEIKVVFSSESSENEETVQNILDGYESWSYINAGKIFNISKSIYDF